MTPIDVHVWWSAKLPVDLLVAPVITRQKPLTRPQYDPLVWFCASNYLMFCRFPMNEPGRISCDNPFLHFTVFGTKHSKPKRETETSQRPPVYCNVFHNLFILLIFIFVETPRVAALVLPNGLVICYI